MYRVFHVVAVLLLLMTAAPVLACATGNATTPEDHACCQAMHGDCGEMAKTGCCQTELRSDTHPRLASHVPHPNLVQVFIHLVLPVTGPAQGTPAAFFRFPNEHSPPGLRIAKLTVLRV